MSLNKVFNNNNNDRQPGKAKFIDNFRLKIGEQSIMNRIVPIFSKIDYNWIRMISDDVVRVNLKKNFLSALTEHLFYSSTVLCFIKAPTNFTSVGAL